MSDLKPDLSGALDSCCLTYRPDGTDARVDGREVGRVEVTLYDDGETCVTIHGPFLADETWSRDVWFAPDGSPAGVYDNDRSPEWNDYARRYRDHAHQTTAAGFLLRRSPDQH